MKYLKTFEKRLQGRPEVNDYVLCQFDVYNGKVWRDYIRNNVGQIKNISVDDRKYRYDIKYFLTKDIIRDHFKKEREEELIDIDQNKLKYIMVRLATDNILKFSTSKEEIEAALITQKFNL